MLLAVVFAQQGAIACAAESGGNERSPTHLAFRYGEAKAAPLSELAGMLRASRILEAWTEYVGARLRGIPISIEVSFVECGEAGSWHDANAQNIIMCYEEIARIYATLQSLGAEGDGLLVSWLGAILGELYHELAHALIYRLALPIAGDEKRAADQFAVLALLHHPHGADLVLGNADYLLGLGEAERREGIDPSQRHASFLQRYYNALCWMYGSDPDSHKSLVESKRLPAHRAESCVLEYVHGAYAWETLLAPFMSK